MGYKYKNFCYLDYLNKIDLLYKYNIVGFFLIPTLKKILIKVERIFPNKLYNSEIFLMFYYYFYKIFKINFKFFYEIDNKNNNFFQLTPKLNIFPSNFKNFLNIYMFKERISSKRFFISLNFLKKKNILLYKLKFSLNFFFKPFSSKKYKVKSKDYLFVIKFYFQAFKFLFKFSKIELYNFFFNYIFCWKFQLI